MIIDILTMEEYTLIDTRTVGNSFHRVGPKKNSLEWGIWCKLVVDWVSIVPVIGSGPNDYVLAY